MKTNLLPRLVVALIIYSTVYLSAFLFSWYHQIFRDHQFVSGTSSLFHGIPVKSYIHINSELSEVKPADKKMIEPPLPALDPPSRNIYLHSDKGITFTSPNKTQIEVPSFAFVDDNGNVFDGEVEMQYREFERPYEIFISGIPTKMDSQNLSTELMFEIRASSYGRTLHINQNNPFRLTAPGCSSELYYFTGDSCWQAQNNQSQFAEVIPDSFAVNFSVDNNHFAIALTCKTKMIPFREGWFSKKQTPDQFIFTVREYPDLFPELSDLKNIYWVYDGEEALKNYYLLFSPGQENQYAQSVHYCDTARFEKSGDQYLLTIKGKKNIQLPVKPFVASSTDELNFTLAYNSYSTKAFPKNLASVENSAIKNINLKTTILKTYQIDRLGIWNIGSTMTDTEETKPVTFIDTKGRTIEVTKGWLVKEDCNSLIEVTDMKNFPVPSSKSVFWTLFPDKKIGIVHSIDYNVLRNFGRTRVRMHIYEDNVLPRQLGAVQVQKMKNEK